MVRIQVMWGMVGKKLCVEAEKQALLVYLEREDREFWTNAAERVLRHRRVLGLNYRSLRRIFSFLSLVLKMVSSVDYLQAGIFCYWYCSSVNTDPGCCKFRVARRPCNKFEVARRHGLYPFFFWVVRIRFFVY
jgi:hypothetical protein